MGGGAAVEDWLPEFLGAFRRRKARDRSRRQLERPVVKIARETVDFLSQRCRDRRDGL